MAEAGTEDTTSELLGKAVQLSSQSLDSLEKCVARTAEKLDNAHASGRYDDKLASHQAYLAKHVAQLIETLRKAEAHGRRLVDEMSPDEADAMVAQYLRDATRERRDEFRAFLDEIEASQGVLS